MKILIVYGTTEGHTRKVSEWIARRIRATGNDASAHDSATLPADFDAGSYDAVIVAASIHQGHYQSSLIDFVKKNLTPLRAKPTAFVSVDLASVLEGSQDESHSYVDKLVSETGWRPTRTEIVAGALVYAQYDFFTRQIMRLIVWKGGGPTDTSQDYEFTDWGALSAFVDSFVKEIGS